MQIKASEIIITNESLIETPDSDALRVLKSKGDIEKFIKEFGNVYCEYNKELRRYIVPLFSAGCNEYSIKKSIYCKAYGCE